LNLYRKQRAKVRVVGALSEWFRVKKVVKQGCALSAIILIAEIVMRESLGLDA